MENEKFEKTLMALDLVTDTNELREIIDTIHYYLFEIKQYRNMEQNQVLLTKIADVASDLQEPFDFAFPDIFGGTNLFGVSFNKDGRPKVYTGYKWHNWTINENGYPRVEECEFRSIKELNNDDEDIVRDSYMPRNFGTAFRASSEQSYLESSQFDEATEILYDELKKGYQKNKKGIKKKVKQVNQK